MKKLISIVSVGLCLSVLPMLGFANTNSAQATLTKLFPVAADDCGTPSPSFCGCFTQEEIQGCIPRMGQQWCTAANIYHGVLAAGGGNLQAGVAKSCDGEPSDCVPDLTYWMEACSH